MRLPESTLISIFLQYSATTRPAYRFYLYKIFTISINILYIQMLKNNSRKLIYIKLVEFLLNRMILFLKIYSLLLHNTIFEHFSKIHNKYSKLIRLNH